MQHLHHKLTRHCSTTIQVQTPLKIGYFSLLQRCVGRARTRETKIKGQPDGARPESNLSSQPFSQSRHPKDKNKSNIYRTSSLPSLGLRAFLSKTAVLLAALLYLWHSGTVAQRQ